ncbi:MAG: GIY-YIG nuclease family protein [Spirochaetes bacterium]|nr:GIY-YIG nuclease family protein [Spirochaetota bacterium]
MADRYWIYMLRCENGHLYTGIAADLPRRYRAHLRGLVKYTRAFRPLEISQCWRIDGGRGAAQRVEAFIKSLVRSEKESLVNRPEDLAAMLGELVQGMPGIAAEDSGFLRSVESAVRGEDGAGRGGR